MATLPTCLHCGGELEPGDRFCAQCGAGILSCLSCGQPLPEGVQSCPACGTPATPSVSHHTTDSSPREPYSAWAEVVERLRRATLGEFELGRELGRGGMAAVFLAHELSLDRQVAIKIMSPGLLMDDGMIERFKREAITIAHLNHPNIVAVHSVRQAEGLHFFVMRYIHGRSLEQVIQQAGKLPLPIVRSILCQVASALTYAHRSRVVHRDVKPANILIDEDGNAVVTDFGIAKAAESPSQTHTCALICTPAYISPEQCSGSEVSGASDQYALGAVAYEMITGVPPFAGSTLTVMQAHLEQSPQPMAMRGVDCPPELEAAILRMLAKDPAERWPNMAQAKAALGASPLAEDDPLRAELSLLAGAGRATSAEDEAGAAGDAHRRVSAGPLETPGMVVGGISILPPPLGLEVGDVFVLVAMVRGQHGTRLPPRAVEWSSDMPEVLRVDSARALATAGAPGSALLTASCKGVQTLIRVDITAPIVDEIVLSPLDRAIHVGDEIRLEAIPRDKRGRPVSRPALWESSDPGIATVSEDGVMACLAPGSTRITALLDEARRGITLTVLPAQVAAVHISDPPTYLVAGESFILTATPVDRSGAPLVDRKVLWTTDDVAVAVITAEGWVATLHPGSAEVTATCEGIAASVGIGVAKAAPRPLPMRPQATLAAVHRSAYRRRLLRSARTGLLVMGLGVLLVGALWLAGRPEEMKALALAGTLPAEDSSPAPPAMAERGEPLESAVAVDSGAPASVVITQRPSGSLRAGGSIKLGALVRDLASRTLPNARVLWSSTDSTVARVDSATGWVRAMKPGRAQLMATTGDKRDSTTIVVRHSTAELAAPVSLSLSPHGPLRVGDTATLRSFAIGRGGDTLVGAKVSWSSSDPRVATVDPLNGQVRARSAGTALILARSEKESAMSQLTILPTPAAAAVTEPARPPVMGEPRRPQAQPIEERAGGRSGGRAEQPGRTAREDESAERRWLEGRMRIGVNRCYSALQSKDVTRVAEMYQPATASDQDKLRKLSRILRTGEWDARVGPRVDGTHQIGAEASAMDFSFDLAWKDAFGGRLSSQPVFRAEFTRKGSGWEMSSCRIVGSPKL
ncbi:MAG: protein kinase domain-containing protein [Gemmatimonadales bacterium]